MATKTTDCFERVYKQGNAFSYQFEIWRDKVTGVCYLVITGGYGLSMTPLLDRDGKPVVMGENETLNMYDWKEFR